MPALPFRIRTPMTYVLGIVLSIFFHTNASNVFGAEVASPEVALSQGQEAFQRGNFAQAIERRTLIRPTKTM